MNKFFSATWFIVACYRLSKSRGEEEKKWVPSFFPHLSAFSFASTIGEPGTGQIHICHQLNFGKQLLATCQLLTSIGSGQCLSITSDKCGLKARKKNKYFRDQFRFECQGFKQCVKLPTVYVFAFHGGNLFLFWRLSCSTKELSIVTCLLTLCYINYSYLS